MAAPESAATFGVSAAAAAMSAFVAAIGIDWTVLFFATAGSFIGAGYEEHLGPRWRAFLMFPAAVVLSAKLGIIGAQFLGDVGHIQQHLVAQAAAALIGLFFYPLLQRGRLLVKTVKLPVGDQ